MGSSLNGLARSPFSPSISFREDITCPVTASAATAVAIKILRSQRKDGIVSKGCPLTGILVA
jgi:hypothetical protein